MRLQFVRASAVYGRARGQIILASSIATLVLACSASSALADASGSVGINFFNGFTINEGQSGSGSLQLNVSPGNSSGFAGTTTQRFNNNNVSFSAPGSTAGSSSSGVVGGGGTTQNFGTGSLQYNLPGSYSISFNQGISYHQTENSSWGLGTNNYDPAPGVAGSATVTVNNVAPTITTANINGINGNTTVNEGVAVTLNMTATDAGSQNTNFIINGGAAGSASGTPGSTRTSGNVGAGGYLPGVYAQTFQADDGMTTAANGPIVQNLTVLNVGPTITSITSSQTIDPTLPFNFTSSAFDPGVALGDTLSYNWDWDNDGFFDDYSGASGTIPANYYPLTNGSHIVTLQVTDSYGGVDTESFTLTVVPEPSTLAMVGLGAAGIGFIARKRRRRK